MGFNEWANSRVSDFKWFDISMIKLSTAAFILMVAKFWDGLLGLEWYWYGLIFVLAAIKPLKSMFSR